MLRLVVRVVDDGVFYSPDFFFLCLYLQPSPAVDAAWASWGTWSDCSKSCDGGVTKAVLSSSCHVSATPSLLKIIMAQLDTMTRKVVVTKCLQTRRRTRPCNTAVHGGSTAICTTTGAENQECNTNRCGQFTLHLHMGGNDQ